MKFVLSTIDFILETENVEDIRKSSLGNVYFVTGGYTDEEIKEKISNLCEWCESAKDGEVYNDNCITVEAYSTAEAERSKVLQSTIILDGAQFRVGEYSIAGNYDDGYTVWCTEDGEDSDTLYDDISFEACVTWCLNS